MSELGNFLHSQIELQKIKNSEMASQLGLGASHLSQLLKGKRRSVNAETLNKMVAGISESEAIQGKLLEAYFRDQTTPRRKDWIVVAPSKRGHIREATADYGRKLKDPISSLEELLRREAVPIETVRALHKIVSQLPGQHSLQELVKELGNFTEDALGPKKGGNINVVKHDVLPPTNTHRAAPAK